MGSESVIFNIKKCDDKEKCVKGGKIDDFVSKITIEAYSLQKKIDAKDYVNFAQYEYKFISQA